MKKDLLPTICLALVIGLTVSAISLLRVSSRPESRLIGDWQEVSWSYEKVDADRSLMGSSSALGEELRDEITRGLVIHESETWQFGPGSSLVLRKSGARNDTLSWKLKGHGHMLQLVFGDDHQEVYKVRELKNDEMVLHFNNDMIARGVVRIVFKRIPSNA